MCVCVVGGDPCFGGDPVGERGGGVRVERRRLVMMSSGARQRRKAAAKGGGKEATARAVARAAYSQTSASPMWPASSSHATATSIPGCSTSCQSVHKQRVVDVIGGETKRRGGRASNVGSGLGVVHSFDRTSMRYRASPANCASSVGSCGASARAGGRVTVGAIDPA